MIETNAREFSQNFSHFRAKAAKGETVRIHSPDGVFLLVREQQGITGGELLKRLKRTEGTGFFIPGGGDTIKKARDEATPAQSPWKD